MSRFMIIKTETYEDIRVGVAVTCEKSYFETVQHAKNYIKKNLAKEIVSAQKDELNEFGIQSDAYKCDLMMDSGEHYITISLLGENVNRQIYLDIIQRPTKRALKWFTDVN